MWKKLATRRCGCRPLKPTAKSPVLCHAYSGSVSAPKLPVCGRCNAWTLMLYCITLHTQTRYQDIKIFTHAWIIYTPHSNLETSFPKIAELKRETVWKQVIKRKKISVVIYKLFCCILQLLAPGNCTLFYSLVDK